MISCKRDMIEPLKASISDAEEKSVSAENLKEQSPTAKDENLVPSDVVHGTNSVDLSRDDSCQLVSLDGGGDCDALYQHSICASQAQPTIYEGHINASEWEDYSQYMKFEGIDAGSTGVYNENQSLMFHTGYGYSPQMPYGPYSPVTTPLPSASRDGQLYSPHQFPFTGPYYQQPPPPSMPYLTPPTSTSQADLTVPVVHQGAFAAENSNPNSMLFGPGYHNLYNSFDRDSFAGHSVNSGFYDVRQGFDSFSSGGFWSDWMKFPDGTGSLTPLASPAASPQPVGAFGTFGQSISPISSGMGSQQQRPFYGFGSSVNPYDRGFFNSGMYHQGTNFGGSVPSLGANGRNLVAFDKGRRRGKVNASLCTCNGALDFLTEQNRGPRATRPKNANTEQHFSVDQKSGNAIVGPDRELYNTPDFVTEYKDAKFFIIKSYSEDNVHKSIKYGVWASTINGNRKLDSAYHEAKESGLSCPVFLFFSVNASAQFCGVAEMIGTVDFERSVDFWQQDKWSGQFPVKWHIIKDVPNSLFRHILLENNDNKPVTNSRDTQEVILEQGLEMLSIFKKYESDMSILDDFDFYEDRQKAMQERKGRQQQQQSNVSRVIPSVVDEQQNTASSLSDRVINQISKSFVHVVQLEESNSVYSQTDKSSSVVTAANEDVTKPATSKIAQNS